MIDFDFSAPGILNQNDGRYLVEIKEESLLKTELMMTPITSDSFEFNQPFSGATIPP